MEQKQIIGMLVSCLAVAAVIFCGRALTADHSTDTQSQPDPTPSVSTSATTTTNYWDYLRGQQTEDTTTATTATDENGNPVTTSAATDENGQPISSTDSTETTTVTTTTTAMTAPELFVTE